MDSSSDEESPRPPATDPGMFVSHWDDDDGIDEEKDPHSSASKEVLWAAENGELDVIRRLLLTDASLVTVRDKDGYTPLHRACYNNHQVVAQLVIEFGAEVDARTDLGWTPLHSAARWNACRSIPLLLRCGADVNARTDGGLTPLMIAASSGDCLDACFLLLGIPGVDVLATNDSGDTATAIALRSNKLQSIFELTQSYLLE